MASVVSMILNPLVIPPLLLSLVAFQLESNTRSIVWLFGVSLLMYTVLPFAYLIFLLKTGRIKELEARERSSRSGPLFMGVILLAVAIVPVYFIAPIELKPIVGAVASLFAINAFLLAVITVRLKISIHVSTIAGFFSILLGLQGFGFVPIIWESYLIFGAAVFAISLVSWARIFSDAHSRVEVAWGICFGLFLPLIEIGCARAIL